MKLLMFAFATVALAFTMIFELPTDTPKDAPNVIVIFMDDLGYGDLSSYGAMQYRTPNLDKMASEGIRFTNFLSAQAVCSASRAGLLTGCYPNRIGFSGALGPNSKVGIHASETTLAELFKEKKYTTGIIGKWHLGDKRVFLPLQHGFDEYFGIPYSNDMWPVWYDGTPATLEQTRKYQYPPLPLLEGNKQVETISTLAQQGLLMKRYTEHAVAFIEKNRRKPFFLYLAHAMPHVPIAVSKEFEGKSKNGLFADLMLEMDWSVGEILKTLSRNGLEENTIVVFTSDNGPWLNFGNHAGSSGGLREGKGCSFEGGLRVPCIVKWNKHIPKGLICNQLASTIDLLPTLAEACSLELPQEPIDGTSLMSLLKGDLSQQPRRYYYYYYRKNDLQAVRYDHWKLVLPHQGRSYYNQLPGNNGFPGDTPENVQFSLGLYDLRRDPAEAYDVQTLYPEIVTELLKVAEQARADLGDDLTGRIGENVRAIGQTD